MQRSEIIKFLILRSLGNFLFLFALFGVGATFGPVLYYEVQFRIDEVRGVHYQVADSRSQSQQTSTDSGFGSLLTKSRDQVIIPKDTQFSVVIPKIGASAKIFPNVDPTDENQFLPILQQGVAHAKGSVFPGMNGTIYLFAHSTDNFWDVGRYNAVFYLLKDLQKGDDISVYFQDVRHNYTVSDSKIIAPNDVSYLTQAQENLKAATDNEQLVLQTCWPPGTTLQRLLVFAKPKGS